MSKKVVTAVLASALVIAAVSVAAVLMQRASETNANGNAPVNEPVNEPVPPQPVNEPVNEPVPPPPLSTKKGETDMIRVSSPKPGEIVSSPLTVEGEARGTWYFEATFPIKLLDGNGAVIAEHFAQAQDEWMTNEYVPFKGTLTFKTPTTAEGTLVLEKSNASGLPEHDDEFRVPVRFERAAVAQPPGGCIRTGCSGQVCAAEEVITTCEFRAEYACYQTAVCERQPSGLCDWTPTPALAQCLANARALQPGQVQ